MCISLQRHFLLGANSLYLYGGLKAKESKIRDTSSSQSFDVMLAVSERPEGTRSSSQCVRLYMIALIIIPRER